MYFWLLLPSIAWFANIFMPKRIHAFLLYPGVCVVCWVLMTATIIGEFSGYEEQLREFDINKNGRIDDAELTNDARKLQDLIVSDTGESMGPYFAIPITAIWVAINMLVLYGLEWAVRRKLTADIPPECEVDG